LSPLFIGCRLWHKSAFYEFVFCGRQKLSGFAKVTLHRLPHVTGKILMILLWTGIGVE
jgi:hypothetical protein